MDYERRVCDYEGSSYQTDFWVGQGREYEDLAERIALRHLVPPSGQRLLDIGAGFGRLAEFYSGYDQVVLLDYSRSLLRQARSRLGDRDRFRYVAANFYSMPFLPGSFDTAIMVRVMHHVEKVPDLLSEVGRVLAGEGTYVLEFASKRHLKSIVRYALGRQQWSPFEPEPYEFVEMNFDFHPAWMRDHLVQAGFHVKHQRTVSHFRLALFKRFVPARVLASLDGLCQPTGSLWQLTPSVFVQCVAGNSGSSFPSSSFFCCPVCGSVLLQEQADLVGCGGCGRHWPIEDGIYNFKNPLPV